MIHDLIKKAMAGGAAHARETARALSDPALLPEFQATLSRKLTSVERKLAYEFLDYLARNSKSPAVATFLLQRLTAEKSDAPRLSILGTLQLLEGLECAAIEPLLTESNQRLQLAAMQTLGACTGERPAELLAGIMTRSAGGEEIRQCAEALARCGTQASAAVVLDTLGTIEKSRANAPAITSLKLALYALGGSEHLAWIRGELKQTTDHVDRWILICAIGKHGTIDDCDLIESEVNTYLTKPSGQINLLTGRIPLPHRNTFQAGMELLHRLRRDRFDSVVVRARLACLPNEDAVFLDRLEKS